MTDMLDLMDVQGERVKHAERNLNCARFDFATLGWIIKQIEQGGDIHLHLLNVSSSEGFALRVGAAMGQDVADYIKQLTITGPTVIFADPGKVDMRLLSNIELPCCEHEILIVAADPDGIAPIRVKELVLREDEDVEPTPIIKALCRAEQMLGENFCKGLTPAELIEKIAHDLATLQLASHESVREFAKGGCCP